MMNYYKQPLSSFVLTVGLVEAAIGSLKQSYSLFYFGLLTIFIAAIISWWQLRTIEMRRRSRKQITNRFLPPAATGVPLPRLSPRKHGHN